MAAVKDAMGEFSEPLKFLAGEHIPLSRVSPGPVLPTERVFGVSRRRASCTGPLWCKGIEDPNFAASPAVEQTPDEVGQVAVGWGPRQPDQHAHEPLHTVPPTDLRVQLPDFVQG